MFHIFFKVVLVVALLYILVCVALFFYQERIIFFPHSLNKDHIFKFEEQFEELNIEVEKNININALLFKSKEKSKGLIFYLHGNAGSLESWGEIANIYTSLHYDLFIVDYRGYGKSDGTITNQKSLFSDISIAYNTMKKRYNENEIIILGNSIGTGIASKIASINHPKLLILQAPYYSLSDIMKKKYSFVPTFLLKYKFSTNQYLQNCDTPIVIFHGDEDEIIYYGSSLKLKQELKEKVTLITMKGQGHNGINYNNDFLREIGDILK